MLRRPWTSSAKYSGIPVINALSDLEHPTQIIADFFTILEEKGKLKGLKLAYVGDGDNVCNSLVMGSAVEGMNISVACPRTYHPNESILEQAHAVAKSTGSTIEVTDDPTKAAYDADVIYTDVWVSMGEEAERERRLRAFKGYQVTPLCSKSPSRMSASCTVSPLTEAWRSPTT